MNTNISKQSSWAPSEKVVSRKIKEKLIIVPIQDGVADFNDVMFSFNETGEAIWEQIVDKKNFLEICSALHAEYDAEISVIEKSVKNLINTLLEKGIIVDWKS